MTRDKLVAMVNQQAEDEGLWFEAQTAPEAYLQQELRELHAAVEASQATVGEDDVKRLGKKLTPWAQHNLTVNLTRYGVEEFTRAVLAELGIEVKERPASQTDGE